MVNWLHNMTIQLNLTPKEAQWLHQQTAGLSGFARSISLKLIKQAHKFKQTEVPAEVKMPGTGNINLAAVSLGDLLRGYAEEHKFSMVHRLPFVKALRTATSIGLAHAVRITEHWGQVLIFVDVNNRLPVEGFELKPMAQW